MKRLNLLLMGFLLCSGVVNSAPSGAQESSSFKWKAMAVVSVLAIIGFILKSRSGAPADDTSGEE